VIHDASKHGPPNLPTDAEARRRQEKNRPEEAREQDQAEPERKARRKGRGE